MRIKRGDVLQALAEAVTLGKPLLNCFRLVEIEDFAGARPGIAAIGEAGDDAGTLVEEGQGFLVIDLFQLGSRIAFGLLFDFGDLVVDLFLLGFDDADGFFLSTNKT